MSKLITFPVIGFVLGIIFFLEHSIVHSNILSVMALISILAIIIVLAKNVAEEAEHIAEKLGEPWGTIMLTLSAVAVEVIIIYIMVRNGADEYIVRDTIVYALILDMGGILGISVIAGALKHHSQSYNMQGMNIYFIIIIFGIILSMVLPGHIPIEHQVSYGWLTVILMIILITIFYIGSLRNYRKLFISDKSSQNTTALESELKTHNSSGIWKHVALLIGSIVSIGVASELMTVFLDPQIKHFGLSTSLAALIVAMISASPELITAIRSSMRNKTMPMVNIALGASMATLLFTVLIMKAFMLLHFIPEMSLVLNDIQMILLFTLCSILIVAFSDKKSNSIEGIVVLLIIVVLVYFVITGIL